MNAPAPAAHAEVTDEAQAGPAAGAAPPAEPTAAERWARWLPMMTALAVAVTPIGVATITSQVAVSGTNKDYVSLAIAVLNSGRSTPAMRAWATNILEKLAPIPMQESTRRDFVDGRASLALDPQGCARMPLGAGMGGGATVDLRGLPLTTSGTGVSRDGKP